MAKIYSNLELVAPITKDTHLVNKKFVMDMFAERHLKGADCVIISDLNADYDQDTKTLTQKDIVTPIDSDTVELKENMRVIYKGSTDATRNGLYDVVTAPVLEKDSTATLSLGASNTGVVTLGDVSINKTTFEAGIGTPTTGSYSFQYDSTTPSWQYNGVDVDITTTYGITIASEIPQVGDTITVVYTERTVGVAGVFKRSDDFNASEMVKSGAMISVYNGKLFGDKIMQVVTTSPFTLDATTLYFEVFKSESGATIYEEVFKGDDGDPKTSFTITHALDTKQISMTIYDETTGEVVYFNTKIVDENVVEVTSDVELLTADVFRIVIVAK